MSIVPGRLMGATMKIVGCFSLQKVSGFKLGQDRLELEKDGLVNVKETNHRQYAGMPYPELVITE